MSKVFYATIETCWDCACFEQTPLEGGAGVEFFCRKMGRVLTQEDSTESPPAWCQMREQWRELKKGGKMSPYTPIGIPAAKKAEAARIKRIIKGKGAGE